MTYNLIGKKYNRLLVLERDFTPRASRQCYWKCLCDCGNQTMVDSWSLRHNKTKSCGCLQKENRYLISHIQHGQWQSRTYHTWEGMKQRCLNPNATRYPNYGGKGILICNEWLDFKNFYRDMGDRPVGKTLDRINPYGNYEPTNCRWATYKEQVHNRRRNHRITEEVILC